MKKYVILLGHDSSELENKVIDHIEKGYEPCGGICITILAGGKVVMNQAMWLIPTITVMAPNFEDRKIAVKEISEMLTRMEEDKLKDGN